MIILLKWLIPLIISLLIASPSLPVVQTPLPYRTDLPSSIPPSANPSILPSATPTATPKPLVIPSPHVQAKTVSATISENSLWDALTTYRSSHNRPQVVKEEALCVYARQRVTEHQDRFKDLKAGESQLDGHTGFQRDADSGALFNDTGSFTQIAEVLAYLPNAQTATQVIEWGWDTSSPHREGLLSNDFTHACIVGTAPFYVGILGRR